MSHENDPTMIYKFLKYVQTNQGIIASDAMKNFIAITGKKIKLTLKEAQLFSRTTELELIISNGTKKGMHILNIKKRISADKIIIHRLTIEIEAIKRELNFVRQQLILQGNMNYNLFLRSSENDTKILLLEEENYKLKKENKLLKEKIILDDAQDFQIKELQKKTGIKMDFF